MGRLSDGLPRWSPERGTWYILLSGLLLITLLVDPRVYLPYHTPKNFALLVIVPMAATGWWISRSMSTKAFVLHVSILELLLVVRLVWAVVTNPSLVIHPSEIGFYILAGLTGLTLLTRQLGSASSCTKQKDDGKKVRLFLRMLILIGGIQSLIGLWQWYVFAPPDPQYVKTWVIGTTGPANGYAALLAIAFVATVTEAILQTSRWLRGGCIGLCAVLLITLALNGSRGAALGMFVAGLTMAVLFLFHGIQRRRFLLRADLMGSALQTLLKQKKGIAGLILLGMVLTIGFVIGLYAINPSSSSGRIMVWRIAAPMVVDHPVQGIGQGRFGIEYLNYQARYFERGNHHDEAHKAANLKQAHNEYLQAFCESGLVGGLLFLSIWGWACYRLFRYLRQARFPIAYIGLAGVLLIVLTHALVDAILHVLPVAIVAYLALGLIPIETSPIKWTVSHKGWRWGGALVLGLVTLTMGAKVYAQYPAYITWQTGVVHAENQRWTGAIEAYTASMERLPEKGELEFHLGSALVFSDAYSRGIYFLEQSLNTFNDRNVHLALSYAYLKLGNLDAAETRAKLSLSMFPDHLMPHLLLGEIYYKTGEIEASKAALRKCIERRTQVQSADVAQIAQDARALWQRFYGDYQP